IEDHERLSAEELAELHGELRGEVRDRAADLRALEALLDEHRRAVGGGQRADLVAAARAREEAEQRLRDAVAAVDEREGGAQRRGDPVSRETLDWDAVTDRGRLDELLGRLRNQTMAVGPESVNRLRAFDELDAAAEHYRDAVAEHQRLEAALLRAVEHDALIDAGAHALAEDHRVGIVDGHPRRLAVVVWGEGGPQEILDNVI
ncbi:hypothetical protein ACW9HQ_46980, partial [Nocardia gipuzkoensis]